MSKRKLYEIIEKPLSGEWGNDDETGEGIPVLRTTNFTNDGVIDYTNVVTRIIDANKVKEKFLRNGDIIIEKSGGSPTQPVGRVVLFEGEDSKYLFNNFTSVIRLKDKNSNSPKFLLYYLLSNYKRGKTKKFQNKTTGISNLKLDRFVKETEINLPPLETQKHIAKALDTVSELLALNKQQLSELDDLIKSFFYDMFGDPVANEKGWVLKPIGDFSIVKIGPFGSLLHTEDYIVGGFPLVNPSHIVGSKIVPDTKLTLSAEKFKKLQSYSMNKGDVVVGRRGEIGRCAVVEEEGLLCGTGSMFIRIEKDYLPLVLQRMISSETVRNKLAHQSVGVTMKNLNTDIVSNLEVPMIPLPLQKKFTEIVTKIEEQRALVQKTILETQYLFESLMAEFFE